MSSTKQKSVRFPNDFDIAKSGSYNATKFLKTVSIKKHEETSNLELEKVEIEPKMKMFRKKKLSRVFSEDYDGLQWKILDPRGRPINIWNKCFLIACLTSLFVDPLFFYLPSVNDEICMDASYPMEIVLTVVRSVIDAFYLVQILVHFRTAYVAPSSRVFGRGELVIDSSKIASRYLQKDFWVDLLATLPLPQVLIWAAIPSLRGSNIIGAKHALRLTIISQFLLRLCLIFPLSSHIIKTTGVMVEAAWAGAVYNLVLFMLGSHVMGSCWYLLAVERQEQCWKKICDQQQPYCQYWYFDCQRMNDTSRIAWYQWSNISTLCGPSSNFFQFGIFNDALTYRVTQSSFLNKYTYCFWWGLRNLSSIGQNLMTTTDINEINFAVVLAILGLLFFALLIGNMQASHWMILAKFSFLQSTTKRLEEWRIRRTDTEEWMDHRQLPHDLKERVRKYDLYRWVTARGVDEESIIRSLPVDLRRDIKRHLCLDLVRRVPLFDQMDECILDAICERLKPLLYTAGTCLVREADPVKEMHFIIRGHLDSYTTDGGRTGFFNSCKLGPCDFCGEELLTWALDPRPSIILPSSTRTVIALTEVEAFALSAEDVTFVASQFRKLHSKQLRHTFRFYSNQWRTWAACFIQAAWFRYKRRKEAAELNKAKQSHLAAPVELRDEGRSASLGQKASEFAVYAAKLATSTRKGGSMRGELEIISSLQKPIEPDFSVEDR
ncbi:putative cyclic nucleotide-gated ion channel 15 [Capsicum annuum]|uniref:Cyclic nucleotide-gated ion channel 15 n=1 Tax=Capsicum annuum TaxID=4072 RepID=A0A2G2YQ19_CAPAN|nr:putative cyclic nucleotide-gated ion channel 15 [Capsicum annuum]